MQKTSLFEIFKIFIIIGAQLLGGGYVILPLLKKYIVEERKWINEEELIDYFALSQCIPGIIAGNISVFVGYKIRKLIGALTAIIGLVLPSFIAIIILANLLLNATSNKYVQDAFWGIRVSVIVLIFLTIKDMWKKSVNTKFTTMLFLIIFLALLILPISPTIIIILSAIVAIIYSKIVRRHNA